MRIAVLEKLPPDLQAAIIAAAPDAEIAAAEGRDEWLSAAHGAEIIFGAPDQPALAAAADTLRWLQLPWAGADRYVKILSGMERSDIMLTSAVGAYGIPLAEHLFAMLLALTRHIRRYAANQRTREWQRQPFPEEVAGKTALVLGYGDAGREFARRAKAFDLKVLAVKRNPAAGVAGADEVHGPEDLPSLIGRADIIVNCLPLNSATRGLLNRRMIEAIKPGAYLLNVGRGATIDEQALVEALQDGRLAGAGLDVFVHEPLPAASPLWDLPNVLLTPHVAGATEPSIERIVSIFCENLGRYQRGDRLRNLADLGAGY